MGSLWKTEVFKFLARPFGWFGFLLVAGVYVSISYMFVLWFFLKSLTKLCYFFSSIISSLRPDFDHEELTVPEITHIQLSPKISTNHVTRSRQRLRELSLNQQFPCRVPGYELQILDQPEDQHRARYLTEGSRGAVKNKAGDGHAVVKVHNSCNIGQQNC